MSEIIQRSEEWYALRCGKVTASRIADVIAKIKSGWGASRANYKAELVSERLTGITAESFINKEMQWGIDHEQEARENYQFIVNEDVQETGFVVHPDIPDSGASPDGLTGNDGMVEIKCPNTATHIETLQGEGLKQRYIYQMMWQMACCQRQWCDFVSYDPRMPPHLQIFIKRIERDDEIIAMLEKEIKAFLQEIDDVITSLNTRYQKDAA
ncbi:phage-related exonuclease [Liberibacter crescens BT-1]|uniref:Phage-related exonuclease n=1 Tax=Liberibacter crescens (strain BT-1) TaxID=1215343 RepID=L0EVP1_LIBCB|nr:lambda exonuclease family protein [Liberibacter crescens]AGA64461.1 phage-related exonuclease [Liberibacter crescens BT-1]AMC12633.1 exonuclease [Liberibacter crescens]